MTRCCASRSVRTPLMHSAKPICVKTLTYAEEIDAPIHMHLHETAAEVEAAHRELGTSHIHYLAELGLLVPRLQAVHLTQVDDAELELLAESRRARRALPTVESETRQRHVRHRTFQAARTASSDSAPTAPPRTTRSICSPSCALRRCSRRRSPAIRRHSVRSTRWNSQHSAAPARLASTRRSGRSKPAKPPI